jgi:hypothetical protein
MRATREKQVSLLRGERREGAASPLLRTKHTTQGKLRAAVASVRIIQLMIAFTG